ICQKGLLLVNIQDILHTYAQTDHVKTLVEELRTDNPKIQVRGLVGSSDAMVVAAAYLTHARPYIFVLPTHEDASYFLSDLESLFDKQIQFFPASYRKAFDFRQIVSTHVLQRSQTLNVLNRSADLPIIVLTYPEAIAVKVFIKADMQNNSLEITLNTKLSIDF